MDGKMLARIGAVVFVAVAITATAIELTRKEEAPVSAIAFPKPALDPHRAALRRCRDMGEAAMRDPACLRAWAENRDRFLGQNSSTSISDQQVTAPTVSGGPIAADDPTRERSARPTVAAPVRPPEPAQSEDH